jgi:hypothetical protein
MPNQRVQLVRALNRAFAQGKPDTVRFVIEKPDTTDWLKGDTIVAHFDSLAQGDTTKNPAIKQITASGHASSLYHMAPSDSAERRPTINYVTARVIEIAFSGDRKVSTVTTLDSLSGVYIEPRPDSTARPRAGTTASPAVKSIVPLPTKPTTTPPPPATPPPTTPPVKPPVGVAPPRTKP